MSEQKQAFNWSAVCLLLCFVFLTPFVIELVLYPNGPFFVWRRSLILDSGQPEHISVSHLYLSIYVLVWLLIVGAFIAYYILSISKDARNEQYMVDLA